MNLIIIGLNWTVSVQCPESTFVLIWCFLNKTELNSGQEWNDRIEEYLESSG